MILLLLSKYSLLKHICSQAALKQKKVDNALYQPDLCLPSSSCSWMVRWLERCAGSSLQLRPGSMATEISPVVFFWAGGVSPLPQAAVLGTERLFFVVVFLHTRPAVGFYSPKQAANSDIIMVLGHPPGHGYPVKHDADFKHGSLQALTWKWASMQGGLQQCPWWGLRDRNNQILLFCCWEMEGSTSPY